SANRSGRPSPTRPEHVRSDFGQDAPYILDGGACPVGVESTVLDISGERPILLRPGGVGRAAIEQVLGEPVLVPERSAEGPVRSPGMKYRHYAPDVPLILIEGPPESVIDRMEVLARRERAAARRIGWLLSTEGAEAVRSSPGEVREVLGPRDEPRAQAARLFDALRRLEEAGVDVILAEGSTSPGGGVEAAVIDRLRRASARVERVGGAWR
ncbi:MAG TPA: Sua5 family C-terminal domain-containing protein, partial [Limnochordia bacterium]